MSSFVWNGPLISSAGANWISVHPLSRCGRYWSPQLACAQVWLLP